MSSPANRRIAIPRTLTLGLALCLVPCAAATALDLVDGRIKLSLYEGSGRFSIAYQSQGGTGSWVPLLAAQDPRTTMLAVVVGNKIYTMGESSEFSQTLEKTATGARFVWKSAFLQVTESFGFVSAARSSVTSGVRIELTLRNLSTQDATVGARYLFDTYLGEPSFVHFKTDTISQVTRELALLPADKAAWWQSPLLGDAEDTGFQVMLGGAGITPPDRVVFANWKRLSDSAWVYDVSTVRNFSLLPYSVNDSAAGQYYDPKPLARNAESTIVLAVGKFSKEGFSATAVAGASPTPGTGAGTTNSALTAAARADLASVDSILAEIDAALAGGAAITDERLAALESALRDLQQHASSPASAP